MMGGVVYMLDCKTVACGASVSEGLRSNEKLRNEVSDVFPARKIVREQTNPWIIRQRMGLVIGWTSRILLTGVDQRT